MAERRVPYAPEYRRAHVLAMLHDPAGREANAGALRMAWPRSPLPGWLDPGNGAPGNGASEDAGVPPATGASRHQPRRMPESGPDPVS